MPALNEYDVVVIGAGVVGCVAARELARYQVRAVVLEAGADIACGATRANSGIVHTGYDPEPGTLKAAYNVRGAAMFASLQRELGFAYRKNGALVVAFDQEEIATLEALQARGRENGAPETYVIDQAKLRELEPNIAPEAIAVLHVPDSGICDPYGFAFGMAENAADNGVEFVFNAPVVDIAKVEGGYQVTIDGGRQVATRAVVNAAGAFSDVVNNMVSETKLTIAPRRGEYHLFKDGVRAFGHTMFPVPNENGKGILVGTAAFGNQFVGPNACPQDSRTDVATSPDGLDEVMTKVQRMWPGADEATVISNYAGIRATNADTGDFVIGPVEDAPGFFNAACIDSPGLASSPAIGLDLATWVAEYLDAPENPAFNPIRVPAPLLFMMDDATKQRLIEEDPRYDVRICGCANVTEGEVVAALHRSVPVGCFEALKWRTGITMGECQGGRCVPRILAVMAAELGVEPCDILRRAAGSYMVSDRKCACEVALPPRPNRVYEKPRSMYRIPGTRPAGIFSAYGALCVMARTGYLPGENVLVWGSLDQADECAAELERAGAQVIRVPSGRITLIEGEGRIISVTIADADGVETVHPCDALVMSDEMLDHIPAAHAH